MATNIGKAGSAQIILICPSVVFQALHNIVQFYVFSPCSHFSSKYIFSSNPTKLLTFSRAYSSLLCVFVHLIPFAFMVVLQTAHPPRSHPSSKNHLRCQPRPLWHRLIFVTVCEHPFLWFYGILFINFYWNLGEMVQPSPPWRSKWIEVYFGDRIHKTW